jgi:hypothetical protein
MLRLKKLPLGGDQSNHKARGPDPSTPEPTSLPLTIPGTVQTSNRYDLADDLLEGADEIAAFGGWSRRQVYHLAQTRRLPVFRLGATLCARKSRIVAWIEDQETQTLSL